MWNLRNEQIKNSFWRWAIVEILQDAGFKDSYAYDISDRIEKKAKDKFESGKKIRKEEAENAVT